MLVDEMLQPVNVTANQLSEFTAYFAVETFGSKVYLYSNSCRQYEKVD